MIPRYTRPELGRIWSEENKYRQWLEVELAASEVLAELGEVPPEAAAALRRHADFDVERIAAVEAEVKHDVIAFTTAVAEKMAAAGAAGRFALAALRADLERRRRHRPGAAAAAGLPTHRRRGSRPSPAVLRERAFEFKDTVMVGRTHGVHAEPTTFGLKLANWFAEVRRQQARFAAAVEQMRVGKISGAVGTFAHISPDAEERICQRLGLDAAPISSQVIQRDRHAHYVATLALITATLEKIALEVRHLQRTEVREAQEYFSKDQKGSSAMPHKKNPITSEQICGLARVVRAERAGGLRKRRAVARARHLALLGRARHPGRLDHSDRLSARPHDRPGPAPAGLPRAHAGQPRDRRRAGLFRATAAGARRQRRPTRDRLPLGTAKRPAGLGGGGGDFRALVEPDPDISGALGPEDIARAFELDRQLRHVDRIFERVFSQS